MNDFLKKTTDGILILSIILLPLTPILFIRNKLIILILPLSTVILIISLILLGFKKRKQHILIIPTLYLLLLLIVIGIIPKVLNQKPFVWCHTNITGGGEHCHTYLEHFHYH